MEAGQQHGEASCDDNNSWRDCCFCSNKFSLSTTWPEPFRLRARRSRLQNIQPLAELWRNSKQHIKLLKPCRGTSRLVSESKSESELWRERKKIQISRSQPNPRFSLKDLSPWPHGALLKHKQTGGACWIMFSMTVSSRQHTLGLCALRNTSFSPSSPFFFLKACLQHSHALQCADTITSFF